MIQNRQNTVAVIGSGPGGLAAAMLLAASGISVTLYEARSVVGGRTRRISSGDFHFDCGPTFFMMPYVLEEIFSACGYRLDQCVELQRLDPMYRLVFGQSGGQSGASPLTLDTTQDLDRMVAQLDAINPRDSAAFERFMRDNRRKLRLMTPILRQPLRSFFDLISRDAMKCGPVLRPHQSLYTYLKGYFRDPHIRLALSFQSKYLGMSPYECPSLFSILPFIEYEYGIWHPTGGCNALTTAMAACCRALGVEIITDAPVEKLAFDGNRLTGVQVRGEMRQHDHAVINADATWAMKNLIPLSLRGRETDDAIDRKRYSCSTFMLYLGLDGEVDLPHHTIYVSSRYEENLRDITERGRLSDDPSFYLCNPSRLDPTLAPPGKSAVYLLVPTPNTKATIDWAQAAPLLRRTALDHAERILGVDGLSRRIITEEIITPDDWRAERINHGATFNLAHNLTQMLHRRPQHKMPGTEGVWFVGGGTHPGSGLPVIFLSSQTTARLLCGELGRACVLDQPGVPVREAIESHLPRMPLDTLATP